MSSWTVVEFVDSKSVEAVPTRWLKSDSHCYWPPMTREKLMIEIKNGNIPDENWPLYKIRIFKDGTFDEYVTARRKARKAEDTSDLNSDIDEVIKRKTTKPKKFVESSSETDEEEDDRTITIPSPPKLKFNSLSESFANISGKKIGKDKSLRMLVPSSQNSKFNLPLNSMSSGCIGREVENEKIEDSMESQKNDQPATCRSCEEMHNKIDMFINDISKKMSFLKANMLQIREDIQILIERPAVVPTLERKTEFLTLFNFPLTTYEHLEQVNQYLMNEEDFENAVKNMVKLGGKDTYDFIRRCFQETLSDSLIRNFTFEGTKEKKSFKDLKIGKVILAASGLHNGADRKLTETAVRKWLRRANERHHSKIKLSNKE